MSEIIRLDLSYSLPSPYKSDKEAQRFGCEDLERMGRQELWREKERLKLVLLFGDFSSAPVWAKGWIEERFHKVKALLNGRRRRL